MFLAAPDNVVAADSDNEDESDANDSFRVLSRPFMFVSDCFQVAIVVFREESSGNSQNGATMRCTPVRSIHHLW